MIFDTPAGNPFPVASARLVMRPYTEGDLPQIAVRLGEISLEPLTPAQAASRARYVLAHYLSAHASEQLVIGAFDAADNATLAAHFTARAEIVRPGEWEIGYHMRAPYRRRGLMRECVDAMIPVMGSAFGARFMRASTGLENIGSRRTLEGAGFRLAARTAGRLNFRRAL